MNLLDRYITGREKLLNRVLAVDPLTSLNPDQPSIKGVSEGSTLAAEIKSSINQFKANAMDENGELVDYQQLSRNPVYAAYRETVSRLHDFDYLTLSTGEQRLAFWINLYNTLVIDAVIQEGVKTSVIDTRLGILSFFQKAAYIINGQRFSLTDIEHGVIRSNRGFPYFPGPHFPSSDLRRGAVIRTLDPRIHFALNCASNSCPPIGVYTPEGLGAQLDLATRNFIQGDLLLDKNRKTLSVSSIFRWYQVDFGVKGGTVDFLLNHIVEPEIQGWLEENRTAVQLNYHLYDWGLNQML
ncbi:MAG: DUF547 domain-containing protein [Anaerolineales bacterium]|nr:DUF547 domain-containing protein [Anaerolineales bacterium]